MPSTDRPTSSPDGAADAGRRPRVLFVCVKNAGKSQMAAALTRHFARERLDVHSAGTQPGRAVNAESATAVATLTGERPEPRAVNAESTEIRWWRRDEVDALPLHRDADPSSLCRVSRCFQRRRGYMVVRYVHSPKVTSVCFQHTRAVIAHVLAQGLNLLT